MLRNLNIDWTFDVKNLIIFFGWDNSTVVALFLKTSYLLGIRNYIWMKYYGWDLLQNSAGIEREVDWVKVETRMAMTW